jgi:hypothetical protein
MERCSGHGYPGFALVDVVVWMSWWCWDEGFGAQVAAVAGAAGDWGAGAVDLGDVVGVDLVNHFEHEAGGLLFFLGVVGVVEDQLAVGRLFGPVDGVAGLAGGAELTFPLLHDFVDLFAGEVAGQDFEVGGGGVFVMMSRCGLRW